MLLTEDMRESLDRVMAVRFALAEQQKCVDLMHEAIRGNATSESIGELGARVNAARQALADARVKLVEHAMNMPEVTP